MEGIGFEWVGGGWFEKKSKDGEAPPHATTTMGNPVNWGQSRTKKWNFVYIRLCKNKNALQLWGLPVVRISAQSDVVYWSYSPNTHQNGHNWVLNQKK